MEVFIPAFTNTEGTLVSYRIKTELNFHFKTVTFVKETQRIA